MNLKKDDMCKEMIKIFQSKYCGNSEESSTCSWNSVTKVTFLFKTTWRKGNLVMARLHQSLSLSFSQVTAICCFL